MWPVDSTIVVPIVVSAHGLIAKSLDDHLERLSLSSWVKGQIQKGALLDTAHIFYQMTLPFDLSGFEYWHGGETVAVDLAGWVCDSQNAVDQRAAHKLYLRNLFFRTCYLLLNDVRPLFVLEGEAPDLKRDEMARRLALRRAGTGAGAGAPDLARRRFKGILKECESLLRCMGVSCVRGGGEAEATCAALNSHGTADAVISQDSDCFAYGARRVYRNFSVSSAAGGGGALHGSVHCYDAQRVADDIDFGRNKMVALAVLCGCDYGAGAVGCSLSTTLAFLRSVNDRDVLQRLESWTGDAARYAALEEWAARAGGRGCCERCGHAGRALAHARAGCPACATAQHCVDTGHKAKVGDARRELTLRARALAFAAAAGEPFPAQRVLREFLRAPDHPPPPAPLQPDLVRFVGLMRHKLGWSERYSVEKFLPLLTRAHLAASATASAGALRPARIHKKRKPRGVPSLEVVWSIDGDGDDSPYLGLVPDDQLQEGETEEDIWRTCEREEAMRRRYPDLVAAFELSRPGARRRTTKKKPSRAKKPRSAKLLETLQDSFKNMSLEEACIVKKAHVENRVLVENGTCVENEIHIKNNLSSAYMSDDDFDDEDLSLLIDEIVTRDSKPKTTILGKEVVKLVFSNKQTPCTPPRPLSIVTAARRRGAHQVHSSTPKHHTPNQTYNTKRITHHTPKEKRSRKRRSAKTNDVRSHNMNTSYFFGNVNGECDAFELSMEFRNVDCDGTSAGESDASCQSDS